jgi:hypothetical protein
MIDFISHDGDSEEVPNHCYSLIAFKMKVELFYFENSYHFGSMMMNDMLGEKEVKETFGS